MTAQRSITILGATGSIGASTLDLIRREPNETIARIVAGWPTNFSAARARALGFTVESNFTEIINAHIEDERIGKAD